MCPLRAPTCPQHAPYAPPTRPLRAPYAPPTCPCAPPMCPLRAPTCLLPVMGIKCYGYLEFFLYIVFLIQECYWLMNLSNQVPPMLPYAPLSCF